MISGLIGWGVLTHTPKAVKILGKEIKRLLLDDAKN